MRTKTFDFKEFGFQVVLALGECEDTDYDGDDLRREVERLILPLIAQGQERGVIELQNIFFQEFDMEQGQVKKEGFFPTTVSWEKMLPWWHPENADWWRTPFMNQSCTTISCHRDIH